MTNKEVEEIVERLKKKLKGNYTAEFTFRESLVEWAVRETYAALTPTKTDKQ